jgi:hypothetical protein
MTYIQAYGIDLTHLALPNRGLLEAAARGDFAAVEHNLQNGADPNVKLDLETYFLPKQNALSLSLRQRSTTADKVRIVSMLADARADMNLPVDGFSPLQFCYKRNNDTIGPVFKALLACGSKFSFEEGRFLDTEPKKAVMRRAFRQLRENFQNGQLEKLTCLNSATHGAAKEYVSKPASLDDFIVTLAVQHALAETSNE